LAAELPPGVLEFSGSGILLHVSAISPGLAPGDHGVSQFLYSLISAAKAAQDTVNTGRLSTARMNAVQVNFTQVRGTTIQFGVSLVGHADISSNIVGVKGGLG
jgi:hypothetical protein